jgi:hypothetical protein
MAAQMGKKKGERSAILSAALLAARWGHWKELQWAGKTECSKAALRAAYSVDSMAVMKGSQ